VVLVAHGPLHTLLLTSFSTMFSDSLFGILQQIHGSQFELGLPLCNCTGGTQARVRLLTDQQQLWHEVRHHLACCDVLVAVCLCVGLCVCCM
jgi:hypothetical protein